MCYVKLYDAHELLAGQLSRSDSLASASMLDQPTVSKDLQPYFNDNV